MSAAPTVLTQDTLFGRLGPPLTKMATAVQNYSTRSFVCDGGMLLRMVYFNEVCQLITTPRGPVFMLTIRTPTGLLLKVQVPQAATIGQVLDRLCEKLYLCSSIMVLTVGNAPQPRDMKLSNMKKVDAGVIDLQIRGEEGFNEPLILELLASCPMLYNVKYNKDYRNIPVPTGPPKMRGGRPYVPPRGWVRYGLTVVPPDTAVPDWLASDGRAGEWTVVFHGTKQEHVDSIMDQGLKIGSRNMFGKGVYCTPSIDTAEAYTESFVSKSGRTCCFVMMARANPRTLVHCTDRDPSADPTYYYSPPEGIHVYGVLLKIKA